MIELGQLEKQHAEFARRKTQVVVVSIEKQRDAELTQKDFPHLVVIGDFDQNLARAVEVLHPGSHPEGGDTSAPTTLLIDGGGIVRSVIRPPNVFGRLSPAEVLKEIDDKMPAVP
jgi:alkyl hydroperoxide reductase subunit AhpC